MSKNKNRPGIEVRIIGDRNATAAAVTLRAPWPGGGIMEVQAPGTAKREPGDRHEPETAASLALARALRNVAAELERVTTQRVRDVEQEAAAERGRREMKRMLKALPKQGPKTGEIRRLYGEEAAELHKARQRARKMTTVNEQYRGHDAS